MIYYLDLEEAISIHDDIIEEIGGLAGYDKTKIGLLDSALEFIKDDVYYPTFADKLTHLMFSCINSHPFSDGNKRSAISLAMVFLQANNKCINNFAEFMEDIVVGVAKKQISKDELKEKISYFLKTNA